MAFLQLPLFDAIHGRLSWLTQRQRVLAENIANADTPGFRPHDLEPFRPPSQGAAIGHDVVLARTQGVHVAAGDESAGAAREQRQRQVYEASPSGNAVVLEEQAAKLSETAVAHHLATQLYKKYLGLLRLAATARG